MLENCKKGNHNLVEIYRDGYEDHEQTVVRWCKVCGAVVVDVDYDERTYAGRRMKMIVPQSYHAVVEEK